MHKKEVQKSALKPHKSHVSSPTTRGYLYPETRKRTDSLIVLTKLGKENNVIRSLYDSGSTPIGKIGTVSNYLQ